MKALRDFVDNWYDSHKDRIFERTEDDPEVAHESFVKWARIIHKLGLEKLLLNCPENALNPGFEISNAAGLNKNGEIPPTFLRYLGFDRVVVGTVTADAWDGNPRPRIKRYPETNSLVNWMGLPGVGAERVADNLISHGNHRIPITINLMATPGKQGDELLRDLEKTVLVTRGLSNVDRYELNISCPNTHGSSGKIDAREEYLGLLSEMLGVIKSNMDSALYELWVKPSPDTPMGEVKPTLDILKEYGVDGLTIGNTTREHDPRYVTFPANNKGTNGESIGGASGNAVYRKAKRVQDIVHGLIGERQVDSTEDLTLGELGLERDSGYGDMKIIAVGGINSAERAIERTYKGDDIVKEIQIFTPLIFNGPKLLRQLRAL